MTRDGTGKATGAGRAIVSSNLGLRVISGIMLGAAVLALTFAGGLWFAAFACLVAALMLHEWLAMCGVARWTAHFFTLWAGLLLVALAILTGQRPEIVLGLIALATVAGLAVGLSGKHGFSGALGLAYSSLSALALSSLRQDDAAGLTAILFLFAIVWSTDIFAYFVGKALGGPKLAPAISPGKTWSGAIGGTAGAMVAAAIVVLWAGGSLAGLAAVALGLSAVSQIGDLAESAAKRRYGVKDSGTLIPGHGGVLDRVDGLVAAAIALYAIGWALSDSGIAAQGLFPS